MFFSTKKIFWHEVGTSKELLEFSELVLDRQRKVKAETKDFDLFSDVSRISITVPRKIVYS